jgi:hypothetical protein
MQAMFERVVPVPAIEAGAVTDPDVRGVFEPVLEDFSFVTPRDTGTSLYAVSLKYRINAYTPAGQAVDSWTFTGYGAQAGSSMPGQGKVALQQAASLAMRDAGAKIAVEFREQCRTRPHRRAAPLAKSGSAAALRGCGGGAASAAPAALSSAARRTAGQSARRAYRPAGRPRGAAGRAPSLQRATPG